MMGVVEMMFDLDPQKRRVKVLKKVIAKETLSVEK
jgi:hypothetical protein